MSSCKSAWLLASCFTVLVGCRTTQSVGIVYQDDAHPPHAWRELSSEDQAKFDLGYAVFNTEWAPANTPAGRTDGLGPLFNAQSCDACHNSRRRGRGPRSDGEAPADLVMQLGKRLPDGSVQRGIDEYGYVLNTTAISGYEREASVSIRYEEQASTLADGTQVSVHIPSYEITRLSGPVLAGDTVLMPRIPPSVQGAGLLELVPQSALVAIAESERRGDRALAGRVSTLESNDGAVIGRFGWQATEPTVAAQTASALSREMGLTSPLVSSIDCGRTDAACLSAPAGGSPEVEPSLFDAVVYFESLHAVPARESAGRPSAGGRLFTRLGCDGCHRSTLPVDTGARTSQVIHPYTDLLLHDMGTDLADRDLEGNAVLNEWRTAPLWGLQAAVASRQPLRLLHDGRARSIQEAILWHGGQASKARERFIRLPESERRTLESWIAEL